MRWYCRYGISYRELEEMLGERGVEVDHTTLYRWTQRYAPELEKRTAWYRSRLSFSWRVDETYVRVKGRWKYLYRAIDKDGATLDFYPRRPAQHEGGQALPRRSLEAQSGLDPPGDQHRQEPGLWRGDRRAEEGGRDPARSSSIGRSSTSTTGSRATMASSNA